MSRGFWTIITIIIVITAGVPTFLYGAFGVSWLHFDFSENVQNRPVTGIIMRNQTWSEKVYVTGDVYVAWWAKVKIKAGTEIKILEQDDQKAGQEPSHNINTLISNNDPTSTIEYSRSHIEIKGRFEGQGRPDSRIFFTPYEPDTNFASWVGLTLRDRSYLEYTNVQNTQTAIRATGNVRLDNVVVENSLWNGLRLSRTGEVTNSIFAYCGIDAILTDDVAKPVIKNNTIRDSNIGLNVTDNSAPQVINNQILNNAVAIFAQTSGAALLKDNKLESKKGPGIDGFFYKDHLVYPNKWEEGKGNSLEGSNTLN